MFKNYIKIAVRNLLKNKVYSLINIFGLAIGLATSLLILLYVLNEWNYDTFNERSESIFRVIQTMESENNVEKEASTPFLLGPVLEAEFPDLLGISRREFLLVKKIFISLTLPSLAFFQLTLSEVILMKSLKIRVHL